MIRFLSRLAGRQGALLLAVLLIAACAPSAGFAASRLHDTTRAQRPDPIATIAVGATSASTVGHQAGVTVSHTVHTAAR